MAEIEEDYAKSKAAQRTKNNTRGPPAISQAEKQKRNGLETPSKSKRLKFSCMPEDWGAEQGQGLESLSNQHQPSQSQPKCDGDNTENKFVGGLEDGQHPNTTLNPTQPNLAEPHQPNSAMTYVTGIIFTMMNFLMTNFVIIKAATPHFRI